MKTILIIILLLVLAAVAAFAALVIYGRLTGWETSARQADQGRYDFAALRRSKTGNDALACTADLCEKPDIRLPAAPDDAETAFRQLEAAISEDPDIVERVDDRSDPAYRRYVVRTGLMRFPDTVDVKWSPEGWRAMSRSLIGRSDMGANAKRLRRWFGTGNG